MILRLIKKDKHTGRKGKTLKKLIETPEFQSEIGNGTKKFTNGLKSKLEVAVKLNRCVKLKIEHRNYPICKEKKVKLGLSVITKLPLCV